MAFSFGLHRLFQETLWWPHSIPWRCSGELKQTRPRDVALDDEAGAQGRSAEPMKAKVLGRESILEADVRDSLCTLDLAAW